MAGITSSGPARRRQLVSSAVLGMLIFVFVELMFFAGLISAFLIAKGGTLKILWPPPDQPRFPVQATALNTAVLVLSGILFWVAASAFRKNAVSRASALTALALVLGALFVGLQGVEWAKLIREGLTLRSSQAGSYFYLLVGAHAAHALVGLGVLAWGLMRMRAGRLTVSHLGAVQILWTFVVGLWPFLYVLVYL